MSLAHVESVAKSLIENKSYGLRISKSGNVSFGVGGSFFRSSATFQTWIFEKLPSDPELSARFSEAIGQSGKSIPLLCSEILGALSRMLSEMSEPVSLGDLPPTEATCHVPLSQVTVIRFIKNKGIGIAQFGRFGSWQSVDCTELVESIRASYPHEEQKAAFAEWKSANPALAKRVMDPSLPSGLQEPVKGDIRKVNVHIRPPFLRDWDVESDYEREHPKEILSFLEKLFPNEKERDYILCRLYNVAAKRSAVVLVLAGAPKTGKTTYMELERALVGESNYRNLSVGADGTMFDGYLAVSRLIHRDEPNLTRGIIERLKNNVNETIGVSEKNRPTDEQEPIKNNCSFTIAMNVAGKTFELKFEDRKFYVPQISEPPQDGGSPYSKEEYEGIRNAITDVEKLRDLYAYLYRYYKDVHHSPDAPKTESFFRICHLILGVDKIGIVEASANHDGQVFYPNIKRKSPLGAKNARSFLREYEQQIGISLGKISGRGEDWSFTPNPDLTDAERARLKWFLSIHDQDGEGVFEQELSKI